MTDKIEYNLDEEQVANLQLIADEISYLDSPKQALEAAIDSYVGENDIKPPAEQRKEESQYGAGKRFKRGYNSSK